MNRASARRVRIDAPAPPIRATNESVAEDTQQRHATNVFRGASLGQHSKAV
ncbi:hypothetical protein SAMN02745121_06800 [Nannocystis exedens]|uniref:Uncharacterized protein n=1 Tax=Nannocystis exedens TaxID=54 RepID=A0A1I2FRP1_9BACT|nr:hypothetical protein NAEX_06770 [Nannocystis exedens]SFF08074.1 hypothetical protein SAMN02745121_06800 [Nannocystis exedens]